MKDDKKNNARLVLKEDSQMSLETMTDINFYKYAIEQLNFNLVLFSKEGTILFCNKKAAETMGGTPDQFIGKSILDIVVDLDEEENFRKLQLASRSPTAIQFEDIIALPSGKRWFRSTLMRIVDEQDNLVGIQAVALDITDLKNAEEATKESEQRCHELLSGAPVGVFQSTPSGRYKMVNPAFAAMGGFSSPEEMIEQVNDISTLYVDPVQREEVKRLLEEQGELKDYIIHIRRKDSSEIWLSIYVKAVRDASDKVELYDGFAVDITKRVLAETEAQKAHLKIQTYLDIAGVILVALDLNGNITLINRKGCELIGYKEKEVLGKNWINHFVPERFRLELTEVFDRLLKGEEGNIEFYESAMIGTEGTERLISWHNVTINDEQDRIVGTLSSGEDVTEKRKIEDEKAEVEYQLWQSQKMESIGRLAGGVAHDFNNLLTAIQGFSLLVFNSLEKENPIRKDVQQIRHAADSASMLTQQLLAFSRKQIVKPRPVNMSKAVNQSEKMIRRIIGEDIELDVHLERDIWRIKIDPRQIDQILVNLAVNARDAISDSGKLVIETGNITLKTKNCNGCSKPIVGDFVILSVSDDGSGIDEDTLPNIFEPFFTTKEEGKGTGLGLSTIHGIVHQNDGHIRVFSKPGVGSHFKIYFPRIQDTAGEVKKIRRETADTSGTETILLVEDQEVVRRLVLRILKNKGYKIIEADSGIKALDIIETTKAKIDLLLTDVVMPKMNGRELYDHLKGIIPGLNVLYMSGYTEETIAQHGVLDEKTEFIQKPFHPDDLAIRVREILNESGRAKTN